MAKRYQDSSKADYIKSDIRNFFKPDEDDGFLTRSLKGAGSVLGESAVNTGANIGALITDSGLGNYIPGWDGGDVETDLTEQDLEDAIFSIPALRGIKVGTAGLKAALKAAKKGGLKDGINTILKKMGPQNAAKRTSASQLKAAAGFGPKGSTGKLARLGQMTGAGYMGKEMIDRADLMGGGGVSLDSPDGSTSIETLPFIDPNVQSPGPMPGMPGQPGQPNLDNPEQQSTPGSGRLAAAKDFNPDPKDKTRLANQMRNTGIDLAAEGRRQMKDDIRQQKISDRIDSKAQHINNVLRERALNQAILQNAKDTGVYYNSADEAKKERRNAALQQMANMGGSFVDPNDPENKNQMPGQVSREEFTKNTGLSQDGTGIMTNPDGSVSTLETGGAFDRAGGLDTARDVILSRQQQGPLRPTSPDPFDQNIQNTLDKIKKHNEGSDILDDFPEAKAAHAKRGKELQEELAMRQNYAAQGRAEANEALANSQRPRSGGMEGDYAKMTNLERQTLGGDKSYRDQFGEGPGLSRDTVRLSSDMADYGDAAFQNREDALAYLNRGVSDLEDPAPDPMQPMEPDDDENDWWKYAAGAAATAAAMHPATRGFAKNMLKWNKKRPMQGPMPLGPMQGPNLPLKQRMQNPWTTASGSGRPMQGPMPLKPMQGPMPRKPMQGPMPGGGTPGLPQMSPAQFQALSRAPAGTTANEAMAIDNLRRANQRLNQNLF